MKKIISLVALCMVVLGFSQSTTQLKVSESPEFKDEIAVEGVLAMHVTEQGNTGMVRSNRKYFLLNVFDKNLNQKSALKIETDKKEEFAGFVTYQNQIKFITIVSPSKRERIVTCHTFDVETNTHFKKELFQANVEKGGLFTGRNKRQSIVAISPNAQYIAIATDNVKKDLNSYKIHLFNAQNMDLVFEKSYQENEEKHYEMNDFFVDDNANVYSLGRLFISGKSEKKNGEANYEFILNKVSKNNIQSTKIALEEGKHIASLIINQYQNKINLLGFYSEKKAGNIKGGCNFEINSDNLSVLSIKNTTLPKDVYEDLYGDAKAERMNDKKRELNSFYVDYIIRDNLGNTYLLAEEFYITQTYVSSGMYGAGYFVTTYHYDDILILKFDAKGEINWGRSVYKRSTTPSYNAFLKENKLHILLNSGKNLTEKTDGRTKVSKGWFESTALYDFTYSENGNVEYNKIQDNKGNTFYLPYYGIFNIDRFIMMSDGVRKKQFMVLE